MTFNPTWWDDEFCHGEGDSDDDPAPIPAEEACSVCGARYRWRATAERCCQAERQKKLKDACKQAELASFDRNLRQVVADGERLKAFGAV